jgi:hypothetical protein
MFFLRSYLLFILFVIIYVKDCVYGRDPDYFTDNSTLQKNLTHMKRDTSFDSLAIGFSAGAVEAFIAHPLWVWKTRAQYGGAFTLQPRIIYKGVVASMATTATIVSMRVLIRDFIIRELFKNDPPNNFLRLSSAFMGGVGSTVLSCPLELCLTQQQTNPALQHKNFMTTSLHITQTAGADKLFKGSLLIAMRDGIVCMGYLGLTPLLNLMIYDRETSPPAYLALFSGVICAFVSHPLDFTKTIIQSAELSKPPTHAIPLIMKTYSEQGLRGLYKGFTWRCTRVGLATCVLSKTLDQFTYLFKEMKNREHQ